MRFAFQAMLALAVGVTVSGVALGLESRVTAGRTFAGTMHTSPLHRLPSTRIPIEQAVAPPLPLSPRYGEEVSGPPVISWRLMSGTSGARVELCPTMDFDGETTRHIDVAGDKLQLPASWPAGVWYWRLRGRTGRVVGDRATPTWMLFVTAPPPAPDQG